MRKATRSRFMLSCILIFALIAILCSLAVSCSQGTGPESATYTSSNIGSDGGALELTTSDGTKCSLTIPEDLLSATTEIKITAVSSSTGSSLGALSNDFLLEPEGLEFDEPVTIEITLPNPLPADRAPAILHTAGDGPGVLLETQVDGQTLSASLDHFSQAAPVAPTAQELQVYWDSILLEIDTYGVSVERVLTLASICLHAQANSDIYASIDLTSSSGWKAELWRQTNDLIIKGSLRCESGECDEGEYILNAAINIASVWLFTDLLTEAQQALDTCRNQTNGTISINQTPDELAGAEWSLTGPRNESGSGDRTLTGMPPGEYTLVWDEVDGYHTPSSSTQTLNAEDRIAFSGVYISEEEEPPLPRLYVRFHDSNCHCYVYFNGISQFNDTGSTTKWHNILTLKKGENTARFVIRTRWDMFSPARGTFDIKVEDEIVMTVEVRGNSEEEYILRGTEYEKTVTLTL